MNDDTWLDDAEEETPEEFARDTSDTFDAWETQLAELVAKLAPISLVHTLQSAPAMKKVKPNQPATIKKVTEGLSEIGQGLVEIQTYYFPTVLVLVGFEESVPDDQRDALVARATALMKRNAHVQQKLTELTGLLCEECHERLVTETMPFFETLPLEVVKNLAEAGTIKKGPAGRCPACAKKHKGRKEGASPQLLDLLTTKRAACN